MHGEDDQIVPIAGSALLAAKLVKNGTLKVYPGLSHGMCTTHAETINQDLLAFIGAWRPALGQSDTVNETSDQTPLGRNLRAAIY